ncbi:endonuclease/exonuclease/phosphatase (EEP) superfamily protein YafD [Nonomuraea fuscirosea]|uniref:Endonuclease/exonuclease/phosphatase (EEP) superfamily protein YafD n=1 Tax=Nonomuraea fuscirosea TaxID=1291556 RepID=A0A2T0MYG6_9ACTN|nr:endonuclease/exonuclease/phosphatase family protein [Nonomuraea fuscirosea]PRX64267.1 endonuclease/exonuclease/phosphatase (EEP) superfamily protein YafD [Nonomuraea fuscirosea]
MSWIVVAPFGLWAVVRLSGFEPDFPWVPVVSYTPYALGAALLGLVLACVLRRWAAGTVALVSVLAMTPVVLPRAFADGNPGAKGPALRVLAANLLVGGADTDELTALVTRLKPDVLTLQEFTPAAMRRLEAAGLRRALPHAVTRPVNGVGGSAIYARHPLDAVPMIKIGGFGQARAWLKHSGGTRVEIVSVHPCAPKRTRSTPCWQAGLEALPRGDGKLRVLAGDFNATLDHLPMRDLLAAGYRDAADVMGRGLRATWPQGDPPAHLPGVTIDHVLADSRMAVRAYEVLSLKHTDHRPVFAELQLPR